MYIKKEKYVNVNDDWYPNWHGNKIIVRMSLTYNELQPDGTFPGRICIYAYGMDDDDMTFAYDQDRAFFKDLKDKYKYFEENVYNKIPDMVNHKWFEKHGFTRF